MNNESTYNQILKVVCEYYNVRRYDVLMKRDNDQYDRYNRARCVSIYFMRMITGDAFKLINDFFQFSCAGSKFSHVTHHYMAGGDYRKEVDEIEKLMNDKIQFVREAA